MRYAIAMTLILTSLFGSARSQTIVLKDKGMLFPVVLEIGPKRDKQISYSGGNDKKVDTAAGTNLFMVSHKDRGFPYLAKYVLTDAKSKKLWESESTYEPRRIELGADQTLTVEVMKPYRPYNGYFGTLKGVPVGIIFPRPYWFQDVNKKWEAKEDYPNSLFFLVDKAKWGPEKVFSNLAANVTKNIGAGHSNYRADCHVSFILGYDAEGKVPKALRDMKPADLEKAVKDKCLELYAKMRKYNCYRPMNTPQGLRHVSFEEGLRQAAVLLPQWKKKWKKD